jgi:hypothetical protein
MKVKFYIDYQTDFLASNAKFCTNLHDDVFEWNAPFLPSKGDSIEVDKFIDLSEEFEFNRYTWIVQDYEWSAIESEVLLIIFVEGG